MASPLQADGEDLLQAALSDAFSVSDLPREPVTPSRSVPSLPPQTTTSTTSTSPPPESPATPAPIKPDAEAEALGLEAFEAWKADYDVQQARWKAENAEQRAKAEAERAKWEAIRAAEKGGEGTDAGASAGGTEEGMSISVGTSSEVWERLLAERHMAGGSPSPVDGRDVVAGDKHTAATDQDLAAAPNSNTDTSSPRWEDVPSDPSELTSSFPSLSFPSHSKHASGSNNSHPHPNPSSSHHTHSHPNDGRRRQDPTTATATLAVFDSTLSARTRVWALVGSLGVNLLLPFVNGVMLGFGEIFARDVLVGWFGWNSGGTTGAGLRTGSSWFRRR